VALHLPSLSWLVQRKSLSSLSHYLVPFFSSYPYSLLLLEPPTWSHLFLTLLLRCGKNICYCRSIFIRLIPMPGKFFWWWLRKGRGITLLAYKSYHVEIAVVAISAPPVCSYKLREVALLREKCLVCMVRNLNAFSCRIIVYSDYFSTVLHIHHIVFFVNWFRNIFSTNNIVFMYHRTDLAPHLNWVVPIFLFPHLFSFFLLPKCFHLLPIWFEIYCPGWWQIHN